jgi:hypothetical protein
MARQAGQLGLLLVNSYRLRRPEICCRLSLLNKRLQKSEPCATYFLFAGSRAWRFETACDSAERETLDRKEKWNPVETFCINPETRPDFPYLNRL